MVGLRGAAGWIRNPDRSTDTASNSSSSSNDGAVDNNDASGDKSGQNGNWFKVYHRDGNTVSIHWDAGGAMYEDEAGRTYVYKDDGYYSITEDKMFYE